MDKYFVHPSSYVDENVQIGQGTKIWHFSHVQSDVEIGENCSFGQNVNISSHVKIGNGVKAVSYTHLDRGSGQKPDPAVRLHPWGRYGHCIHGSS